jgi:hypothetical protein
VSTVESWLFSTICGPPDHAGAQPGHGRGTAGHSRGTAGAQTRGTMGTQEHTKGHADLGN